MQRKWNLFFVAIAAAILAAAITPTESEAQGDYCPSCSTGSYVQQSATANAPASTWREHREIVRVWSVYDSARFGGTGCLVQYGGRNLIVTAYHIYREQQRRCYIELYDGSNLAAQMLFIDRENDVAVLTCPALASRGDLVYRQLGDGSGLTGRRLTVCGAAGGDIRAVAGNCGGYSPISGAPGSPRNFIRFSGKTRQGDSGSPVLDEYGKIVAVQWGCVDNEVWATQIGVVRKRLAETGIFGTTQIVNNPPPRVVVNNNIPPQQTQQPQQPLPENLPRPLATFPDPTPSQYSATVPVPNVPAANVQTQQPQLPPAPGPIPEAELDAHGVIIRTIDMVANVADDNSQRLATIENQLGIVLADNTDRSGKLAELETRLGAVAAIDPRAIAKQEAADMIDEAKDTIIDETKASVFSRLWELVPTFGFSGLGIVGIVLGIVLPLFWKFFIKPQLDTNRDGRVTTDEILGGVGRMLSPVRKGVSYTARKIDGLDGKIDGKLFGVNLPGGGVSGETKPTRKKSA